MRSLWSSIVATWRFAVAVALRWYRGGVGDLAAGVTFWILVSLPAAVLALLAALGSLSKLIGPDSKTKIEQNVMEFIGRIFNEEGSGIGRTVSALFQQTNSGLLTVSLAVALWSVSRGFSGLIRALEDIYEVDEGRTWYHTRLVGLALGLGSLLVSVPIVLMEKVVWDSLADGLAEQAARGVVDVAVLVLWASTIYHFGPAQRSRWRHSLPGAATAAVGWFLMSIGFGFYVSLTSNANEVTAAVGAGLLALTWLWLAAQVLLIGGTVNYLYTSHRQIPRHRHHWRAPWRRRPPPGRKPGSEPGSGQGSGQGGSQPESRPGQSLKATVKYESVPAEGSPTG